jgi:hypothetical protein
VNTYSDRARREIKNVRGAKYYEQDTEERARNIYDDALMFQEVVQVEPREGCFPMSCYDLVCSLTAPGCRDGEDCKHFEMKSIFICD